MLSLVSLPPTAQGQQPPGRFSASSGLLTPGIGEVFRVTVVNTDGQDNRVRIGWAKYTAASCSGMPQVCRHTVESRGASALQTLNGDDAISFDVPGTGEGVNVTVSSSSRNVRILGVVFDTSTQRIKAICTFIPD